MELQLQHQSLISFRIYWFDLLVVLGTLKSLLQYHNSKASILQHSAFFMVQLSHSYMTTGKTIALTLRTFSGKVISLLFNMLFRFVIFPFRLLQNTEILVGNLFNIAMCTCQSQASNLFLPSPPTPIPFPSNVHCLKEFG